MEGSIQVLVKVMLFQFLGPCPIFNLNLEAFLLMLSIDVSFVLKKFWKGDKNFKIEHADQYIWRTM